MIISVLICLKYRSSCHFGTYSHTWVSPSVRVVLSVTLFPVLLCLRTNAFRLADEGRSFLSYIYDCNIHFTFVLCFRLFNLMQLFSWISSKMHICQMQGMQNIYVDMQHVSVRCNKSDCMSTNPNKCILHDRDRRICYNVLPETIV